MKNNDSADVMLESQTLSIAIAKPWKDVYETIWRPQIFPKWASGLSQSTLEKDGTRWRAVGPTGTISIRFTEHNPFGVMDHYVDTGGGPEVYVPLRVIANVEGAEVLLTLFRQPGMSDEQFLGDRDWVRRDLSALRSLVQG